MARAGAPTRRSAVLTGLVIASTRPGRVGLRRRRVVREARPGARPIEKECSTWPRSRCLSWTSRTPAAAPLHPARTPFAGAPRLEAVTPSSSSCRSTTTGFNAPLKKARDFLNSEWRYKRRRLVGYGGVAAGTRTAQMIRGRPRAPAMVRVPRRGMPALPGPTSSTRTSTSAECQHASGGPRDARRAGACGK